MKLTFFVNLDIVVIKLIYTIKKCFSIFNSFITLNFSKKVYQYIFKILNYKIYLYGILVSLQKIKIKFKKIYKQNCVLNLGI